LALYLGGFISPPILIPWKPTGDYQDYLSVDKKFFYVTLKDSKREDTNWGRITTFKYDFKGNLIETGEFANPAPVTTNQDDWRKTIAHSYLANPPGDPDLCVSQYAFYGYSNLYKNNDKTRVFTFDPDQAVKEGGSFQTKSLSSDTTVKIEVARLTPTSNACTSTTPSVIKDIKVKALGQSDAETVILSVAAIQIT
jgi:hypothetical protein